MNKNLKLIWASAYSALITGLYVAGITIAMELNEKIKPILVSLSKIGSFPGHHWVTKSYSSVVLFIVLLTIFSLIGGEKNELQVRRALWLLIIFTIISAMSIFAFFVWHYLVT
ncbi:MAG: hypothetical protein AAB590_00635 [Patescibacteria group bacterium]